MVLMLFPCLVCTQKGVCVGGGVLQRVQATVGFIQNI